MTDLAENTALVLRLEGDILIARLQVKGIPLKKASILGTLNGNFNKDEDTVQAWHMFLLNAVNDQVKKNREAVATAPQSSGAD